MVGYLKIVMKSRMMGDYQVRFCERLGVKLPRSTRPFSQYFLNYKVEISSNVYTVMHVGTLYILYCKRCLQQSYLININ